MAFNAFLKIDGVDGESTDEKHAGWIEIVRFGIGVRQQVSATAGSSGGACAERTDFSNFMIRKLLDKSSPKLALACAAGTHINKAKHFFAYVASNPFSREELLEVAKWLRPTSCRPPKNCPKPTEQELLNMLCLMVYKDGLRGDFRLVELKAPKPSTLKFEKCCIGSMKQIELIIDNTKLLGPVLCIAKAYEIIASHTRTPALISALSAAYNATQTNWELFADAMLSLSEIQRKSIFKIAQNEYFKHNETEMNQELGKYWKGIMDATE